MSAALTAFLSALVSLLGGAMFGLSIMSAFSGHRFGAAFCALAFAALVAVRTLL